MSRRARERREAMDAKRLAMAPADETTPDDDGDFDSLAIYRDAEDTESEVPHERNH